MKITKLTILISIIFTVSCVNHNYTRIEPENLIDFSAEKVSFSLHSPSLQEELANWIENDHPTSVELGCSETSKKCEKIVWLLNSYGITYDFVGTNDNIVLVYNKVLARDCNRVTRDSKGNIIRSHNLGCAVSANIVQMVSDHKQFVQPNLLGLHDATKSVNHYNNTYLLKKD